MLLLEELRLERWGSFAVSGAVERGKNIRDYIFKGYMIPYLIDEENDVMVILDIFKWVDK